MNTTELDDLEVRLGEYLELDKGFAAFVDSQLPALIEQARRSILIREYFLKQPKEVWCHYKAALEYKP